MKNTDVLNLVFETALPASRVALISATNTLLEYGITEWLNDLDYMYGRQDTVDIDIQEVLGLLHKYLLLLAKRLGVEFVDTIPFEFLVSRLSVIKHFIYDNEQEEIEDVELYYAKQFAKPFDRNPDLEVLSLYDCDGLHANLKEVSVYNVTGEVGEDAEVPLQYMSYVSIMNEIHPDVDKRIPILRGLTEMSDMLIDYYVLNIEFEKLTPQEIGTSMLLVTILDRSSRDLNKRDRFTLFEEIGNGVPTELYHTTREVFRDIVERYHGAKRGT